VAHAILRGTGEEATAKECARAENEKATLSEGVAVRAMFYQAFDVASSTFRVQVHEPTSAPGGYGCQCHSRVVKHNDGVHEAAQCDREH
jgi:hypothetical protein